MMPIQQERPTMGEPLQSHQQDHNSIFIFDYHRRELETESSIDPAVIAERGYESIHRPTNGDQRSRDRLRLLHIPSWAIKEDRFFPGLLIPVHGPTGARVTAQWKPRIPVPNRNGKSMKYASVKGQLSRLDVHPRNKDKIADPTEELWAGEGIKKGDSLTSRGVCAVSLNGVYGWRSTLGTLGDWEDVPLRGRTVTICFDSDARSNPNVLRAMIRFGRWLRSKGVRKVYYLIVPAEVGGKTVKGVDDFFAAGGTLEELKAARATLAPNPDMSGDTYTDARLAETIADDALADRYIWVSGLGWLGWDGQRWTEITEVEVTEVVRQYALERFAEAVGPNLQPDRHPIARPVAARYQDHQRQPPARIHPCRLGQSARSATCIGAGMAAGANRAGDHRSPHARRADACAGRARGKWQECADHRRPGPGAGRLRQHGVREIVPGE
jgi:Domain of unknown function (DUF3854)